MKNNQGQSLVELVTSVAIFTMICFSVLSFFGFATNTYYNVIRNEKLLFEYRLLSYAVESTVKNSSGYKVVEDEIIITSNEDITLDYAYAKRVTDYVTSFNTNIDDDMITVTFGISVQDVSDQYQMKILLPWKNE